MRNSNRISKRDSSNLPKIFQIKFQTKYGKVDFPRDFPTNYKRAQYMCFSAIKLMKNVFIGRWKSTKSIKNVENFPLAWKTAAKKKTASR